VSWAGLTPTARQSAYAAANTDTFLGERFRRLSSRPGGGGRKKAGCAVGRSILIIVSLLDDSAARYRDLVPAAQAALASGPFRHARNRGHARRLR
jgi:transposase